MVVYKTFAQDWNPPYATIYFKYIIYFINILNSGVNANSHCWFPTGYV